MRDRITLTYLEMAKIGTSMGMRAWLDARKRAINADCGAYAIIQDGDDLRELFLVRYDSETKSRSFIGPLGLVISP